MKQIILLLCFTFSISAMAHNTATENKTVTKTDKKSESLLQANVEGTKSKTDFDTDNPKKQNTSVQIAPEGSRLGLNYYVVDFINRSNLKFVKCFLKD